MLICTHCGRKYPAEFLRCPICNEPLQLPYFEGKIKKGNKVWKRFADFYPFTLLLKNSLGEGDTPLLYLPKLSQQLKINIYAKNETQNPTWSFKDRGTFVAMQYVLNISRRVGTVSTGNMGASVAAYAAHLGVKSYILVSKEIPEEKLAPIGIYGSEILRVMGDYGELYYKSIEVGKEKGIYFINSDNPFRVEGYKSIAYELAEKIDGDYVIIPTSSGGLFRGIHKGYVELKRSDLIEDIPELICAQAAGCSPIYNAFSQGKERIERVEHPNTIAHAIRNPYPPSGNAVLRILKEGNHCEIAEDHEILEAQKELAKDGLFVQPASAVSLAVVKKLVAQEKIEKGSKVILVLTGAGLKYIPPIRINIRDCSINDLSRCFE